MLHVKTPSMKMLDRFTPANWIQIGLICFAIVAGYFGIVGRMSTIEAAQVLQTARMTLMDSEGTKGSQREIAKDVLISAANSQTIGQTQTRIANLETQNLDLVPKVARIDANVQILMEWMREKRYDKNH